MRHLAISTSQVVLHHGDASYEDQFGARDVWVFQHDGHYFMHYDAAGSRGWLAALATSDDGLTWTKQGPILELGQPGEPDSASASYGTTYFAGDRWHMFYLGTPHATPDELKTPSFPYQTLKAVAVSPQGPWTKQPDVRPLQVVADTWYSHTASPGQVTWTGTEWLMIFSAATVRHDGQILRTLGLARTGSLDEAWQIDPEPLLPLTEQVENSSLYYQPSTSQWFLFTNHIAVAHDVEPVPPQLSAEYTDAVWVYWAQELTGFNTRDKAVAVDAPSSGWSPRVIGLPSVIPLGSRLALYYDGAESDTIGHGDRDVAMLTLELPIVVPD